MSLRCFICAKQMIVGLDGAPVVAVKMPEQEPLYRVLCWTHRTTHRRGFGKMALEAMDGPEAGKLVGTGAVEVELDDPGFLEWAAAAEVMAT